MPLIDLIVLLRVENSSNRRLHSEHRKIVAGNHLGQDAFRLVVDADGGTDQSAAQHLGERLGALLKVLVHGIRMHPCTHVAAVVCALLIEHHQPLGLPDGQLPQQDLVEQRENGRIGADAEGEGEDRHRREERVAAQTADGQTKVSS
jgi:hypothetical protein